MNHCARLDSDFLMTFEENSGRDTVTRVDRVTDVGKTIDSTIVYIIVESMALRLLRLLQL
jgi:hypothetical protein